MRILLPLKYLQTGAQLDQREEERVHNHTNWVLDHECFQTKKEIGFNTEDRAASLSFGVCPIRKLNNVDVNWSHFNENLKNC
jgi:hypothetical protein